jgi:hypothetical protein
MGLLSNLEVTQHHFNILTNGMVPKQPCRYDIILLVVFFFHPQMIKINLGFGICHKFFIKCSWMCPNFKLPILGCVPFSSLVILAFGM